MVTKVHQASCIIDVHPAAKEIAGYLQQELTSTAINNRLEAAGQEKVKTSTLSYHRRLCLGLAPLAKGRPKIAHPKSMEPANISEIRDEALKVFLYRLKAHPETIKNSELVPILTAILRKEEKDDGGSDLAKLMGAAADRANEAPE